MRVFWFRLRNLIAAGVLFFLIVSVVTVSAFAVYTGGSEMDEGVEVPILMYHSLLKDEARAGKFVITPDEFESDLKQIQACGYETITMQQLIDYVGGVGELPEKPIILTFDDGYYNNYLYAFPLLQQYQMKAVLSIIGRYTDEYSQVEENHPNYSHVKWSQAKEMMDSGLVEIQNHTYNMHSSGKRKGTQKLKGESEEQYRKILTDDVMKLQYEIQQQLDWIPTTFAYPFGSVSYASFPIVKEMGFKASLSCQSGVNRITKDPECLYMLKRNLRVHGKEGEKTVLKLLE